LGAKNNGSQPSPISAARATFFGPSAAMKIGISLRSGWTVDLSALPSPAPALQREVVERAVVLDRCASGDDLTDHVDVLAGAGQRARVRLSVPALDDLWSRGAESEDEAAAREVVERDRRHRRGGRRARRELDDAGAESDAFGLRAPPREGVRASDPYASAVHTESKPRRSASLMASSAPAGGPADQ
jgi:hypothetical protein